MAEKTLVVKGMDCADCAFYVEKEVSKIPWVESAQVSLATQKLKVVSETQVWNQKEIVAAVERLRYEVDLEEAYRTVLLNVEGMDCADEEALIKKKMVSLHGIKNFDIYLISQQLKVAYDPALTSVQDIIKSIAETGMKASIVIPLTRFSEREGLTIAASIEFRSEHPLAEAIVRKARETGAPFSSELNGFEALVGLGVKAQLDGRAYLIGSGLVVIANALRLLK